MLPSTPLDELNPAPEEAPRNAAHARVVVGRPRVLIAAVVVAAAVAGVAAWAIARNSSSDSRARTVQPIAPVALSASGLAALAHTVGQPIYWAGPRSHYLYELHRTPDGNVYIRYLPPGVDAGAQGNGYLTVATYPFKDAFAALRNVKSGEHISIPAGAPRWSRRSTRSRSTSRSRM